MKNRNKTTNKKIKLNDDDFEYYGDYDFSENEISESESDNDNEEISSNYSKILKNEAPLKNTDIVNISTSVNQDSILDTLDTLDNPTSENIPIVDHLLNNINNMSNLNNYNQNDITIFNQSSPPSNVSLPINIKNNSKEYKNNFPTLISPNNHDTIINAEKYKLSNSFNDSDKESNKLDSIICGNCNKTGHYYKNCPEPLSSYGLLCYRKINNEYKIILVRRKDTIGYIEFLRGKYELNDLTYIKKLFDLMTNNEKQRILHVRNFDKLREMLGLTRKTNVYKAEYDAAKSKFEKLLFRIDNIVNESDNKWFEPEWGIPKGRRHFKESDIDCSIREFSEETLINPNDISILTNVKPLEEIYTSFNGVTYRHVYYFSEYLSDREVRIDPSNNQQAIEISDIKWANYTEGLTLIRDYHEEKRNIFKKALQILYNKDKYFEEVCVSN